jgi:DNA modification methylase
MKAKPAPPAKRPGLAKAKPRGRNPSYRGPLDAAAVWMPRRVIDRWTRNPRKNAKAVPQVKASIERFGFVAPLVVWDSKNRIIAGDTRIQAFDELVQEKGPAWAPKGAPGPGLVPVRLVEFASEAEASAYAIADNRLGELAEWDEPARDEILREIASDRELFDATGYDFEERFPETHDAPPGDPDAGGGSERESNAKGGGPAGDDPDAAPSLPKTTRTKPGDLWLLGPHRLICGDSTKAEVIARLVDGAKIDLLWTDPPYNVEIVGGAGAGGREMSAQERKARGAKVISNDAMDGAQFASFLAAFLAATDAVMREGAAFYIAHADNTTEAFRRAVREGRWHSSTCLVWVKERFVLGRSDYHSRHEPILYGWKEGAAHHAVTDRTQDTIWMYPRPARSEEHPTMKPVELVERAIANSTDHGQRVLDCFGGSGTTLIACERRERIGYLCELDPAYCDVIVDRWESYTGRKATRDGGAEEIEALLASRKKFRS